MSFPNSTTSYGKRSGGDAPANPYARSAAAWDERIGSAAAIEARRWAVAGDTASSDDRRKPDR